jgi:signal transduction histidine kinase
MKEQGKGTLTAVYEEDGDARRIKIEDTGVGIPEKIRPLIMEPFFTTKGLGKGTGLGLSISFGIVAKHGGALSFTSTEGAGTSFVLSFPLKAEPGKKDDFLLKGIGRG